MKKPTIHVITKYFYPVAAGIETNILETYSKLASKWDITIHASADEYLYKNSNMKKPTIHVITKYFDPSSYGIEILGYDMDCWLFHIAILGSFSLFGRVE
jgi:CO dehydrogenase/acetyl-CoA synthase epsilon subunit